MVDDVLYKIIEKIFNRVVSVYKIEENHIQYIWFSSINYV